MLLKIVITVFVILMVRRTWQRRTRRELNSREAAGWTGLWVLVLLASLWPQATDVLAQLAGISRGADLLIFISVVALFTLVSWLLVRVEKLERSLTQVVREEALRSGGAGSSELEAGERPELRAPRS